MNSPDPCDISLAGRLSGESWGWTYSDREVFLVGSLLVENVLSFENRFEDVGFSILVSLTVSGYRESPRSDSRRRLCSERGRVDEKRDMRRGGDTVS